MSVKFQRTGQLSVEVNPNANGVPQSYVTIPDNITIEFDIQRQSFTSTQTGTFRIYNLAEKTRNLLQKDLIAWTQARAIQFRAGYQGMVNPLIFNGRVLTAYSEREGVDMITTIEAFDGGHSMATNFISLAIAAGTSVLSTLKTLIKNLGTAAKNPIIGSVPGSASRGQVLYGNVWDIIVEKSNGLAMIDNGQVKILNPQEVIDAQIPIIDSDSGLLGSPRRGFQSLSVDVLFEPRLTVGQLLQLKSSTNPIFNGLYKVMGFHHSGTISPVKSGPNKTTIDLFFGQGEWQTVKGVLAQ